MESYKIVDSLSELKSLAFKMSWLQEFAFDTETNTLRVLAENKDFKLVGISVSWGEYNNYYIPTGHLFDDNVPLKFVVKYLKPIFENPELRLIGWNIKFDLHVLARIGIFPTTTDLFDGMIASWLCDENTENGLKYNSKAILGAKQDKIGDVLDTVTKEEKKEYGLKGSAKPTFDFVRVEAGAFYAIEDAYYTWGLYMYFLEHLEYEDMFDIYNNVYKKFIIVLFKMEERGVCVDKQKLAQMQIDMDADLKALEFEMLEIAGVEFNPGSNQQLAELLFGYVKPNSTPGPLSQVSFDFPVESTTGKGMPQTSSLILKHLSKKVFKNPRKQEGVDLCKALLEYKKLSKLKSAFVDGILEELYDDDKVHPSFNIIGTTSGRISCSSPNLQQLPKAKEDAKYQIRSVFVGSMNEETGVRNKLIAIDYKNLEMVLLAHFSEDENLVDCFMNDRDSHGDTAVKMFLLDCTADECKKKYPAQRDVGKTINFGLMYGMSAPTLAETLIENGEDLLSGIHAEIFMKKFKKEPKKPVDVAQMYMDMYFETYSGVAKFIKDMKKFAHRNEFVYSLVGRKRRLPNINGRDYSVTSYEERLSVNAKIQGSAGDVTMNGQVRINDDQSIEDDFSCFMLMQIHDELVFECPEENVPNALPIICHYMTHPFGDDVELNVPLRVDSNSGDSYQEAK